MIDLDKVSGLPIAINPDNTLKFNKPLDEVKPSVRTLHEMSSVLLDPAAQSEQQDIYYMYRNVHFKEDEEVLKTAGVSYDITVIPAGRLGTEFPKTVGHYHAVKPGTQIAYPEVYEVLNGHALFLLQKMDPLFEKVISVIAMEAKAGDKVVYPPNYGHVIVNIGDEVLITSNWVGDNFERLYDQVSDRQGMAYYVVDDGNGGYKFVPNINYEEVPKVRMIDNKFMNRFDIMAKQPMYAIGTNNPKALEFLIHPDKYAVELSSITS